MRTIQLLILLHNAFPTQPGLKFPEVKMYQPKQVSRDGRVLHLPVSVELRRYRGEVVWKGKSSLHIAEGSMGAIRRCMKER